MVNIIRPYYNNSYRANLLLKKYKFIYLVLFLGSELFIGLYCAVFITVNRNQKIDHSQLVFEHPVMDLVRLFS